MIRREHGCTTRGFFSIRHLAVAALIDLAIPADHWLCFLFLPFSTPSLSRFFLCFLSFLRPVLDGCSIILIGRAARITHRGARLWERVEVVLTFWKMAAARALSSSMTSPRNRLLRTVARAASATREHTRGTGSSVRIFGAVRTA